MGKLWARCWATHSGSHSPKAKWPASVHSLPSLSQGLQWWTLQVPCGKGLNYSRFSLKLSSLWMDLPELLKGLSSWLLYWSGTYLTDHIKAEVHWRMGTYQSLLLKKLVCLFFFLFVQDLHFSQSAHERKPIKFSLFLFYAFTHNFTHNFISMIQLLIYEGHLKAAITKLAIPLLHLLLHVNALFLQQLSLSKGPVHRLNRGLRWWGLLPLSSCLLWVVEAEYVVLSHDDAIS